MTAEVKPKTKKLIHVQVGGNPTADLLHRVSQEVASVVSRGEDTAHLTSDQAITIRNIEVPEGADFQSLSISGAINTAFIARVAHAANQGYAQSLGENVGPWELLPPQSQDGMIKGVEGFLRHRYTPVQQHNAWMDSKIADGWVFGEVRDDVKKTSPNLVPYMLLSDEQHAKDQISQSVVRALEPFLPKPNLDVKEFKRLDAAQALLLEVKKEDWLRVSDLWAPVQLRDLSKGQVISCAAEVEGQAGTSVFRVTTDPYVKYGQFDASYSVDVELLYHAVDTSSVPLDLPAEKLIEIDPSAGPEHHKDLVEVAFKDRWEPKLLAHQQGEHGQHQHVPDLGEYEGRHLKQVSLEAELSDEETEAFVKKFQEAEVDPLGKWKRTKTPAEGEEASPKSAE